MTPAFHPVALLAANPGPMTGEGNWTYLIGHERPLLIDAGVGHQSHLDAIAAAAPSGLAHLLVTHAHSDHITGAPAIHERWPAAVLSKYPFEVRDPKLPWQWLADNAIVPTDEGDLTVLHTPGHSPDHLTLWHADSRTLFVGDMLVLGSTVVIPASHGGSLVDYLKSLDRMLQLNPARALPAHGPVIEDPAALINRYVSHRALREEQVLSFISERPYSLEDLATLIYPYLAPELIGMARESALAHLHKLQHEGRVVLENDRWMLTKG
jgi:glyoxylase-like metal-dependent hydrolase (beta-lactamase superfamily II)